MFKIQNRILCTGRNIPSSVSSVNRGRVDWIEMRIFLNLKNGHDFTGKKQSSLHAYELLPNDDFRSPDFDKQDFTNNLRINNPRW